MRKATKATAWAPTDPARWPAGCSPHRDGWVRWYKDRTRFVCGKATPLDAVEDRWIALKQAVDGAAAAGGDTGAGMTYRVALGRFLALQQDRVGAVRNRIEERTLHNYATDLNAFGNFVFEGKKVADRDIRAISTNKELFSAYAGTFRKWKASGFDSVVSRVGALFRWAAEMDYIVRYRPGPQFVRPAKQDIRDERIDLTKSYTPVEVATLYRAATLTMRCWVALGVCAAFVNADIGHAGRGVIDLTEGVIDFRRRKTGKVRRVIPLPPDVVILLKSYRRPEPASGEWADHFFLTEKGNPYTRTRKADGSFGPSNAVSRLFARLLEDTGVSTEGDGRNFTGLRTTFFNLCPRSGYDLERKIIMGRARGTVDLDHYLEDVGLDRLRHVVNHVWGHVRSEIDRQEHAAANTAPAGATPPP